MFKRHGFSFIVLITTFILATSCASKHKKLVTLPVGLSKLQVLKKFGEPREKYRIDTRDHWVYKTVQRAQTKGEGKILYSHTLVFDNGVLMDTFFTRTFTSKELKQFLDDRDH